MQTYGPKLEFTRHKNNVCRTSMIAAAHAWKLLRTKSGSGHSRQRVQWESLSMAECCFEIGRLCCRKRLVPVFLPEKRYFLTATRLFVWYYAWLSLLLYSFLHQNHILARGAWGVEAKWIEKTLQNRKIKEKTKKFKPQQSKTVRTECNEIF